MSKLEMRLKMKKKTMLIIISVLTFAILLAGCDLFVSQPEPRPDPTPVMQSGVIAEGNLVPADFIYLSFAIPGEVSNIAVAEGDTVEKGQLLARLGDIDTRQSQLDLAELAVLEAKQQRDALAEKASLVHAQAKVDLVKAQQNLLNVEQAWDQVETDEFLEALDDARIDLDDAEKDLKEAEEELAGVEDLSEDNLTRQAAEEDVEAAQQAYDEARWEFEALQYQRDLADAQLTSAREVVMDASKRVEATADGPDPDDLALAEANLKQAESQRNAAESALMNAELTAPFTGRVVRIELLEGARATPGTLAMVLIDDSEWFVETNDLTEFEVLEVDPSQKVILSFDAFPDMVFEGEVESISDYFQERFGDITYTVRIRLLESDEALRWGMTADVEF
jgi:multidrug efflux pump subunit AcrA (membrane-fusion protein)